MAMNMSQELGNQPTWRPTSCGSGLWLRGKGPYGPGAPGAAHWRAAPDGRVVLGSAGDQLAGQDSSMASRASLVLLPVIQAVDLLPERARAHGGRHQVRAVEAEGHLRVLAGSRPDSLSIGLTRLATSSPVLALTQPPVGVALAFSLAQASEDEVGLEGLHLGTVGERGHELAAAEDRLARRPRRSAAGRTRRRRRPRRPRCPRASCRRRSRPGGACAHLPLRIGRPPSWKVVVAMLLTSPMPPLT